jgi:hypothetical protein
VSGRSEQFTNDFTDKINFVGNSISVNDISSYFFGFVLIFFSHCNSLGIYQENIYVGKIHFNLLTKYSVSISVCIYQFSGGDFYQINRDDI